MNKQNDILKLICSLVESDAGFESDCVKLDLINNRPVSEREKTLAELVSKIYKIVHPLFSTCSHAEWLLETEKTIFAMKGVLRNQIPHKHNHLPHQFCGPDCPE